MSPKVKGYAKTKPQRAAQKKLLAVMNTLNLAVNML